MSNISTLIDRIRVVVPTYTGFTTKKEIPNPYSLTDNARLYLENGWGLKILSESISGFQVNQFVSGTRDISIVVTKVVYSVGNENSNIITDSKSLMEDVVTLKKEFLACDQLGIGGNIRKVDFVTNSGIEFLTAKKFNFFSTETIFSFDLSEEL